MSGVSEFINEAGSAHRVVVEQTRQLAGKWEKSGLLEGLTGHEKQGMAVMLENQWSWITIATDAYDKKIHVYMNGVESQSSSGTGTDSPATYEGNLKRYGDMDYYLGTSPFLGDDNPGKYFKGDMAKLMVWDRCLSKEEVLSSFNNTIDGLVLDYDFSHDKLLKDQTGNNNNGLVTSCFKLEEDIKVPNTVIPYRTPGRMDCFFVSYSFLTFSSSFS